MIDFFSIFLIFYNNQKILCLPSIHQFERTGTNLDHPIYHSLIFNKCPDRLIATIKPNHTSYRIFHCSEFVQNSLSWFLIISYASLLIQGIGLLSSSSNSCFLFAQILEYFVMQSRHIISYQFKTRIDIIAKLYQIASFKRHV